MNRPSLSSTAQCIARHARVTPETTAIVDIGVQITYRTLAADLVRCVRALEALAVRPGMLVGVQTPHRYLQLLLTLACEVSGATATALTQADLSSGDDMTRYCDLVLAERVPSAAHPPATVILTRDWLASLPVLPAREDHLSPLDRDIAPDQVVRIVRTSGTTGRPKAMPHATQQLRVIRTIGRVAQDILPNPRFLCIYNLTVGTIYVRALGVLQHGGTILLTAEEFVPGLIASCVANYAAFAVGDIERMIQRAQPPAAGHRLHVEVFGAALAPRLRRQIAQQLNAQITNKYSSNETNPIAIIDDDNVGTLCAGVEVRIVDTAGRNLPFGEAGTIRVRSETMVRGYFNDPAMTAAAFIDGWFQTSDIGFMPEPGKLVVLGRADDVLNIGGVKVAPSPLEAELKRINGVGDAVLMTVASPNEVGILLAVVEIDSDQPPSPDVLQEISAVLSQSVSTFEIMPLRWFPRTASAKIKRREIEAAFRQRPENSRLADRLYLDAVAAQKRGRHDFAIDVIRQAISLCPEAAPYHCTLGNALRGQGRLDEAVVCYRKAIDLRPDLADAHYNLATALMSLEQLTEAAAVLQAAIRLKPDLPEAFNALGLTHMRLGRPAEAIPHLREAIRLQSDFAAAHNNLGLALLAVGDMGAGWPEHEWRWMVKPGVRYRREFAQPQWRGEAAEGRTLLIHAEQGLGDSLQFCRYAPLAYARGLRVIIEAPSALIRLLRELPGVDEMVTSGETLPDFDLHCPMLRRRPTMNESAGIA